MEVSLRLHELCKNKIKILIHERNAVFCLLIKIIIMLKVDNLIPLTSCGKTDQKLNKMRNIWTPSQKPVCPAGLSNRLFLCSEIKIEKSNQIKKSNSKKKKKSNHHF